jgi:hypothetical protein
VPAPLYCAPWGLVSRGVTQGRRLSPLGPPPRAYLQGGPRLTPDSQSAPGLAMLKTVSASSFQWGPIGQSANHGKRQPPTAK